LTLAVVADEEEGGGGTWHLVRSGLRGTWAIVPEPTKLKPVVAHKGCANLRVHVRGTAAHASAPEQGVNAIDQAAALIAGFGELGARLKQRQHRLLGNPTLTVCTIQGGFNDYTVPDSCSLTLNRRVLPLETEREVVAEVQAVLAERQRIDPSFAADVQLSSFAPPMETDAQSPVVLALRSATREVLGSDPGVVGWSATCDASILTHAAKVPTVVFGPGSIALDAHRPDESVALTDLKQCARIFASTIAQLLASDPASDVNP
jgi:acetylornithine deacetylase